MHIPTAASRWLLDRFLLVLVLLLVLVFKLSLHLLWGLNAQPQDQESHALPTKPSRRPLDKLFLTLL